MLKRYLNLFCILPLDLIQREREVLKQQAVVAIAIFLFNY